MKNISWLIIIFSLIFTSCVDLDLVPDGSMAPENFYLNEKDADAAVIASYSGLTSHYIYNQYSEVLNSQGTDDAEWGNGRNTSNADKNDLDKFTYSPETKLVYEFWRTQYTVINRCNAAIENIQAMSADKISEDKRNQFVGEAMFVRALLYFNLVRAYGDVPLVLKETKSMKNLEVPRDPAAEVYKQIIQDLEFAETHLPVKSKQTKTSEGRATKGAATALLAKVYLTNKEYQKVVDKTGELIASGEYSLCENYADNFDLDKENGKESVFEIQYKAGTGNPGSSYNGYFRPPFVRINGWTGYGDNPVTENHYNAYKEGDLRRDVNVRLYTREEYPNMSTSIKFPYYCNKYLDFTTEANVENSGNNYPILRYSDVLLMRAEALGMQNPSDAEAYQYINQVRRRAFGLPIHASSEEDLQPAGSKDAFLNHVLYERRLEFAFEGQRRFDLLRTGKLKEAMQAQNPDIAANIQDKHMLLPVPQLEMDSNSKLVQTQGW
jgi:SusD family.